MERRMRGVRRWLCVIGLGAFVACGVATEPTVNKATKAGGVYADWVFIATALVRNFCGGTPSVAKLYYLANPIQIGWPWGRYWTARNVHDLVPTATSNPLADPFNFGGIAADPFDARYVYVLSEGTKPGGGQNDTLYHINIYTGEVTEVSTAGHPQQWWGLSASCDGNLNTIQQGTSGATGGTLISFDPANPVPTAQNIQTLPDDFPLADATVLYTGEGTPYVAGFTYDGGQYGSFYTTSEGQQTPIPGIPGAIGGIAANMYNLAGEGCEWGLFASGAAGPRTAPPRRYT